MKTLPAACLALLLAGCAAYDGRGLRPGASTEAEVRQLMGEPAAQYVEADGARLLLYPHGPLGIQTFRVRVNRDGLLEAVQPVLNDDTFFQIRAGMTRDEVLRMIGPPGETMSFARSRTVAWDYRFVDTWGYRAIFSVTFDENGVVVSKFSRRLERPGNF
jgi:outer membrane protein assembly factor BamE (lipoprotein component of BamABCDE complex)